MRDRAYKKNDFLIPKSLLLPADFDSLRQTVRRVSSRAAQPDIPGRGLLASYGPRFWLLVALIGVAAGLGGAAVPGAAMQSPLAAVVLLLELTHRGNRARAAGQPQLIASDADPREPLSRM